MENDSLKVITESKNGRTESRRALVLDYGFLPGAESELEALLRAWCARLAAEKIDTLSIFTSEPSPGCERIRSLAREIEPFNMWTSRHRRTAGFSQRGLYVDPFVSDGPNRSFPGNPG